MCLMSEIQFWVEISCFLAFTQLAMKPLFSIYERDAIMRLSSMVTSSTVINIFKHA